MRIALRLWLALVAAIVLVLGAGLVARLQEEQRLLLDVTLRDRRFFGHALHAALARGHGSADPLAEARAMLDRQEVAAAHIVPRLVSTSARDLPRPILPGRELGRLGRGEVVVGVHGDEILTYVPLELDGALVLELAEPHGVGELARRIGWWSAVQTLALALAAAVVTFVLARWLVGRPLEQLAVLARRIGAGELEARAPSWRDGDEVGVLAAEMNHMAERLQQTRRALEDSETERLAAMEQLRHADRLRTVGQLATALAHELGTPLNVVSGHARMIEEDALVGEDARASARVILEQAGRITRIVRDLLDFARRDGARLEAHDLEDLARRAARTLGPLARRHAATIEVVREGSPVRARVDGQQMLQVLTNLLTNAMQAMPRGGAIRVIVDAVDASAPTGVHAPAGRYARLAVLDEGTGIDPQDLPHLFEPFFTRKSRGEGTGLGLAVVAGIVKDHGGWVCASSLPKGSRFEVYLPALV